jgi:cytochrome c oxidase subunit 4
VAIGGVARPGPEGSAQKCVAKLCRTTLSTKNHHSVFFLLLFSFLPPFLYTLHIMHAVNALRLARTQASLMRQSGCRSLATTANTLNAGAAPATSSSTATVIPLSNVEAQWARLNTEQRLAVHEQLEVLQKKDWKELSLEEKRAAYYVAFGPHGPRAPVSPPGELLKVILGTLAIVGVAGAVFGTIRSFAPPPPRTINKEWEEAANEYGKKQNLDPITGISSEGYKGTGFVHK